MTTVRTSPIEPGKYWVDVIGDEQIARWNLYLSNTGKDRVTVLSTVHHPASSGVVGVPDAPVRDWVLFRAEQPLVWDFTTLPTPNTADSIHAEEDTVQKPEPEPVEGSTLEKSVKTVALAFGLGLAAIAAAIALTGLRRR